VKAQPAVTAADLERVLVGSAFARIYSFELQGFSTGECTLRVPFQEALERPGGIVAGAVLMAAADVAMWLAIMTQLGLEETTVTSDLKTTFLASARREDVMCGAKVLKLGKTLIYGVAECRTAGGKLLAHHTVTYARPRP
jgi:uncharacterized protein (TIGR00369 family)